MQTTRLEAFSDGVLAIIITIMVLELKVPHGEDLDALRVITESGVRTDLKKAAYLLK
jgi:uncharacterized membrane protein